MIVTSRSLLHRIAACAALVAILLQVLMTGAAPVAASSKTPALPAGFDLSQICFALADDEPAERKPALPSRDSLSHCWLCHFDQQSGKALIQATLGIAYPMRQTPVASKRFKTFTLSVVPGRSNAPRAPPSRSA